MYTCSSSAKPSKLKNCLMPLMTANSVSSISWIYIFTLRVISSHAPALLNLKFKPVIFTSVLPSRSASTSGVKIICTPV